MDFFSRLFGKRSTKDGKSPVVKQLHTRSAVEVRSDNSLVSVYGAGGREIFLNKEEWQKEILPHNQKKKWNKPDELCQLILTGMRDNLYREILDGTKQLYTIDTNPIRGGSLYAIALMETGSLKEAESVITTVLAKHGQNGSLLTLLSKVYSEQEKKEESKETLLKALECDPNQANAVEWLAASALEESGKEAFVEAMSKVARFEGAWRPQIWLGSFELHSQNIDKAMVYFRQVLDIANPLLADGATRISGDLGKAECYREIVELFGSCFNAGLWGILVGNNLVGAYIMLNMKDDANRIIALLEQGNHPEWMEHISYMKNLVNDLP
jgi:tetratricopeptide (TPR) repeat protein